MQRRVTVGDHQVSIEVEQKYDPDAPAVAIGYTVRYSIARTDGWPVRNGLLSVQSYELIDGTEHFPTIESALDYGEAKARNDIATF
ncbi:hypothetical protein D9M68_165440 [compost metagenome]